jgi:hypothetical protein
MCMCVCVYTFYLKKIFFKYKNGGRVALRSNYRLVFQRSPVWIPPPPKKNQKFFENSEYFWMILIVSGTHTHTHTHTQAHIKICMYVYVLVMKKLEYSLLKTSKISSPVWFPFNCRKWYKTKFLSYLFQSTEQIW